MSLTKLQVQTKYPEVYESYSLQAALPEAKYVEKLKFWEGSSINCFERWTIPYFLEREKEKKRPCLRLNYPPDGKCNDCVKGTCRYDRICFMCGQEGHGAFQSFPGGKLKGELKCAKHRNFLSQLGMIRLQHGIDEEGLKVLFKLPGYAEKAPAVGKKAAAAAAKATAETAAAAVTAPAPAAAPAVEAAPTATPAAIAAATPASAPSAAPAPAPAPAVVPATGKIAIATTVAAEGNKLSAAKAEPGSPAAVPSTATSPAGNKITASGVAAGQAHSVSPGNAAAAAVGGAHGLGGNWQLNLDGGNGSSLGLGSSLLNSGYDSLLGSSTLEDSGRRPWAASNGASSAADAQLLGSMAPLLPTQSTPQSSRLSGLALGAGSSALPPGPFPGLGGALGLAPNFDALNLGTAPLGHALGNPLPAALPQAGFGNTLSLNGLPLPMPMPPLGSLPAPLQQLQQYQQAFEVTDVDEYVAPGTLRVTLANLSAESNGALVTKGAFLTHRGIQDVAVRCWRRPPASASLVDTIALRGEIRALRVLSRRTVHVTRVLHHGVLELTQSNPLGGAGGSDYLSLLCETSDLGTLDRFTAAQVQAAAAASAGAGGAGAGAPPVTAFPVPDLQSMCVQLIEGLIQCHELNVRHRDVRPQNILISRCTDEYSSRQFGRGFVLKFTNFVPIALLPLCHASADNSLAAASALAEQDRWLAPEVDADAKRNGVRYQACSDVWSLGLTLYFLATGGQLPFDSHKQACDAAGNPDLRRSCLEKHGLHERLPMLYDLIERLVRPAYMRTDLQIIRCHPFLWTYENRRAMLMQFANATMIRNNETINALVTGIDKISPLYVFGGDGWVAPMAPFLAALIPHKIKADLGWSGTYLLQAIKSQLSYPELLTQSVYPRMTPTQAAHAYLRQITDIDFPRLLILLYELGGIHGKWMWDGDEIAHAWN